jgi:LmbE family N-acetylglucosaminyl deacetylase
MRKKMLGLRINKKDDQGIKILCLGAHCDDIEIGCGGTLLKILETHDNVEVRWIVFSSDGQREEEARKSADFFIRNAANRAVSIEKFRNGYFPCQGGDIKDYFETMKEKFSPDIIFTHYRLDLHQDHKKISELTWNTFRNHVILEYEIPKYDGDFGIPNCFVPLELSLCHRKIKSILESFKSQSDKQWFKEDLFISIMRIRGMECASSTNYAEAFYCRKFFLEI